ncbi:MAG: hypothetical protein ABIP94_16600 [Planctomycetota bacterium]
MTRPTTSLQQHLLTRSDLARLEVPAATILSWLANGWLEQVGRIPDDDIEGDPVFTVLDENLRQELATRLETIGKPAVVLTPLRVRSFLMRALLGHSRKRSEHGLLPAAPAPTTDPVVQHLQETDLVSVLQEAAADLEADVEAMLQLAQEEAELEATQPTGTSDWAADGDSLQDDLEESAGAPDWFDTADLATELDVWEETVEPDSRETHSSHETLAATDPSKGPIEEPTSREHSHEDLEQTTPVAEAAAEPSTLTADLPSEEPAPVEQPASQDNTVETNDALVQASQEPALAERGDEDPEPAVSVAGTDDVLFAGLQPSDQAWAHEDEPTADAFLTVDDTRATESRMDSASLSAEDPGQHIGPSTEAAETVPRQTHSEREPEPQAIASEFASQTIGSVETFLAELKGVLVELAQRPQAAAIDVQPLVAAVQSSLERSAEQANAANSTLTSLGEKWNAFGERMEKGVARAMRPSRDSAALPNAGELASEFVAAKSDRTPVIVLAIVVLALCWSVLFWFKTGSPRLALGTLVGANVLACSILIVRRR